MTLNDVMTPALYTKREIAARYQVGARTVDRWVAKRLIPVIRLSRRCLRFDPARCDEALRCFEQDAVTANSRNQRQQFYGE
jgi:hypothetical protein